MSRPLPPREAMPQNWIALMTLLHATPHLTKLLWHALMQEPDGRAILYALRKSRDISTTLMHRHLPLRRLLTLTEDLIRGGKIARCETIAFEEMVLHLADVKGEWIEHTPQADTRDVPHTESAHDRSTDVEADSAQSADLGKDRHA